MSEREGFVCCVCLHILLNSFHHCLQHERGVHRIQRVPATESHGRLHTSTSVVVVLPQPEDVRAGKHFPSDMYLNDDSVQNLSCHVNHLCLSVVLYALCCTLPCLHRLYGCYLVE